MDMFVHTYNPNTVDLRQEDHEFKINSSYIVRFSIKQGLGIEFSDRVY